MSNSGPQLTQILTLAVTCKIKILHKINPEKNTTFIWMVNLYIYYDDNYFVVVKLLRLTLILLTFQFVFN